MFIGEFGADSYDHRILSENQQMQNDFDKGLWDEALFNLAPERTAGVASGVLVFEWNDEWWKGGSPGFQTVSYETNYGQPDYVNDEKWFGIVDIGRNPKPAF